MNERPLIGILYSDCACRDNEMRIRTYVSRKYSNAVLLSGGDPVLLPAPFIQGVSLNELHRLAERYLNLVDGILLAGGEDVHPKFQDEDPIPALGCVNIFRDEFELIVAELAYNKFKKPMLGICRGIQVMAIALGGMVHQDITSMASVQHSQASPRWSPTHYVSFSPNTKLAEIAGEEKIMVNSFHHQAVKAVPFGFSTAAETSDGIIEAIESNDAKRFCLGVQWHPEETLESDEFSRALFKFFIDNCK
jgi:putative glutamine amidotransferase